mgnify:FL=1
MAGRGLLIAGLSSSSGKTLIALGLMRACRRLGLSVAAAKTGPDYIDPGFHAAALGTPSVNLDPFAMDDDLLCGLASRQEGETLIIEGVMGVHDGGDASSARLAGRLGAPVVLVMDIRGQAETAAAIASGIRDSLGATGVDLAGVILNRCRSDRHASLARDALEDQGITVFGAVPDSDRITMPSRHLGLVQADDHGNLDALLEAAADITCDGIDVAALMAASGALHPPGQMREAVPPPAQRIALARDAAFGFGYEHLMAGWRRMGAEVIPFSPLADEGPDPDAGFVFLPGGYPELHLEALANARQFQSSLHAMAARGIAIHGECGGYMVLGQAITGTEGERVAMTGLLDVETAFTTPRLHLGYRRLRRRADAPLPDHLLGHEFHYTTALAEDGEPLFDVTDRNGNDLGPAGLVKGSVTGSYMHMIAGVKG